MLRSAKFDVGGATLNCCTRRQLLRGLGWAGLSGLAGCSHNSTIDLITTTMFGPTKGPQGYPATPQQIADLPYATLGVRVGEASPAVMVLAQQQAGQLIWASHDRVVFVTQGGRLIQTVGLARDVARTEIIGVDPLTQISAATTQSNFGSLNRLIDLRGPDELSVPVQSSLTVVGDETIEIMGRPRATIKVTEQQRVEKWKWSATNQFWVDPQNHRVWRSVVTLCPQLPAITLELLKPTALT